MLIDERDFHDRLDALESVLPRHNQADRRTVLVGQFVAIKSDGKNRERVHGFVQPQAFDVGPIEYAISLTGHLTEIKFGGEFHVLGFALRLHLFQESC